MGATVESDINLFEGLNIPETRIMNIEIELFNRLYEFYNLKHTTQALSNEGTMRRRLQHIISSEAIGESCDIQFLDHLQKNKVNPIDGITDILPLRGAVSLVPGIESNATNYLSRLNQKNKIPYATTIIGVKRNGPKAHIYYPEIDQLQFDPNKIYRIKDFGIATGGTAAELAELLIANNVRPENIFIQGAVGTDLAKNTIMNRLHEAALKQFGSEYEQSGPENYDKNVIFAVKGQMPIERGEYSNTQYYLDTIIDGSNIPYKITPKDWGDETNTAMTSDEQIGVLIMRIQILFNKFHRTILETEDARKLINHYTKVAFDNHINKELAEEDITKSNVILRLYYLFLTKLMTSAKDIKTFS